MENTKMKITKAHLARIIKEEMGNTMSEAEQWIPGKSMKAGDRARQQRLDNIRRQRQTVDNLAAITSMGEGSAREDIEDAIQMLESLDEEIQTDGRLYIVIQRLYAAIDNL